MSTRINKFIPGISRRWLLPVMMGGISAALDGVVTAGAVEFNQDIRPIFNTRCVACHGGVKRSSGLSLLFREEALKPHDSGRPAILPGSPDESELVARIGHPDPDERMPPKEKALSPEEVAAISRWIADGAPWADHWAYVKPGPVRPPSIADAPWIRNDIDRFVLERLRREGMRPASEADKATLLRRISLDLTGLPPSALQLRAFLADTTNTAYEQAVDRLLASPHYGERWAGMWMDLARYADTKGYEADRGRTIWRYRDWLIEAFNRDLPFDQFTVEQLAGDLLADATPEQNLATALHRNTMTNDEGGTDDEEYRVAAVIDRVNTTWEVWMGTTFSCVQCHGHPYDPFTHEDYYRFLAFFNNTEDADRADDSPVLATHSPPQREKLNDLRRRLSRLEHDLDQRAVSPELQSAYTDWQAGLTLQSEWKPLALDAATSEGGATLQAASDGHVRSGGENPDVDRLMLSGRTELNAVTGLRLTALPHPAFQNGGAGRSPDGNFVLSKLSVTVRQSRAATARGRFIRIQLPGPGRILSLAEVQIQGPEGRPIVPGRASQSSTDYGGEAGRARDGDRTGDYNQGSTTHTRTEADPWWELDLGEVYDIGQVAIWNRTDAGQYRRSDGLQVTILDQDRVPVWSHQISRATAAAHTLSVRERTLPIVSAYADYAQPGFPVMDAVTHPNLERNGWAVAPHVAVPHHAVFLFAESISIDPDAEIIVRLDHRYHQGAFTLGHFRLDLSDDPRLTARAELPVEVLVALDRPEAARTTEERSVLLKAFASTDARLRDVADELNDTRRLIDRMTPVPTPVLRELPTHRQRATHVFERGNWLTPGTRVTAGVPSTLPPLPADAPPDRLGMARWMVSADHPLTARVAVNRFWEQLFGTGLVETLEDFGTQGARPSHPELLDWLAREFVFEHGWSIKRLLKQMVMSATYRQASRISPALLEQDPYNRLLARGPRFRLSAEQIRDQALAVSGLLSPTLYGPSVMPPQPENLWQSVYSGDRWEVASGADRYRRALYTYWKRTSPYPSLTTFDAPSREVCLARRIRTNTPLQALVTLNDPVYVEAAQSLAERMRTEGGRDLRDRIYFGFLLVQARPPTPDDVSDMEALFIDVRRRLASDPDPAVANHHDLAALTLVASALLNLDTTLTRE